MNSSFEKQLVLQDKLGELKSSLMIGDPKKPTREFFYNFDQYIAQQKENKKSSQQKDEKISNELNFGSYIEYYLGNHSSTPEYLKDHEKLNLQGIFNKLPYSAFFIKEQKIDTKLEKKCDDLIDSFLYQNIDFKEFLKELTEISNPLICQLIGSDGFILESLQNKLYGGLEATVNKEEVSRNFINAYHQEFMSRIGAKVKQKIIHKMSELFLLRLEDEQQASLTDSDRQKAMRYFNRHIKFPSSGITETDDGVKQKSETKEQSSYGKAFAHCSLDDGVFSRFAELDRVSKKDKIQDPADPSALQQCKNTQALKMQDEIRTLKARRKKLWWGIFIDAACVVGAIVFLAAGLTTGLLIPLALTSLTLSTMSIALKSADLKEKFSALTTAGNIEQDLVKGVDIDHRMQDFILNNADREKRHSQAVLVITIANILPAIASAVVNLPSVVALILSVSISLPLAIKRVWAGVKNFIKESFKSNSQPSQPVQKTDKQLIREVINATPIQTEEADKQSAKKSIEPAQRVDYQQLVQRITKKSASVIQQERYQDRTTKECLEVKQRIPGFASAQACADENKFLKP